MKWLAYVALLFSALCLFLQGSWSLGFAIAASLCGLLSAIIRHWDLVEKATNSFLTKAAVAAVAAAAIFFSPWIANTVLSEITLLRPSAFPAAYSAIQYISVLFLWTILAYCAVIGLALRDVLGIGRDTQSKRKGEWWVKTERLASLGRIAGLLVLLLYLAPMFLRAANFRSGGVLSRIVVTTSFVRNGGQSVWIASVDPQFPSDCKKLAKDVNLDLNRTYICSARTIRCSNIDPDAEIAFLDDKGSIVVAKDVDSSNILHKLVPMRFDVAECKADNRYDIRVSQR